MDLNKQILNWIKTRDIQQRIQNNIDSKSFTANTNDKVIGNTTSTNNPLDIEIYIKDIERFLREEINNLSSDRAKERFLNAIIITKTKYDNGWSVGLNFDEDEVWSKSLWENGYPNGAYLPTLFAMGYTAKNYVYGYNNNDKYIRSWLAERVIILSKKLLKNLK